MTRIIYGLTGALLLSACGGPGSIDGTIAGIKVDVADAIFIVDKDSDGHDRSLIVYMSDHEGLCSTFKANRFPKNSSMFITQVRRSLDDGTRLAPEAGEYTVAGGEYKTGANVARAMFGRFDGNCTNSVTMEAGEARSGLVKVEKLETGKVASGTFDVTFGGSDKVTGSFNAEPCQIEAISNDNCE